jgi:methylmalonyl-CoA mutase cobalamin-binding subunit
MAVCLLALADTHADGIATLTERLTSIEEIQVLPPAASADEEGLRQAAQTDAEIVLVWLAADNEREMAAATALLERAEALGLRDRSFLALIGPQVTRDMAHQLLFEEGYPVTTPTAQLLWSLAQEAIARDELRRRGSSPPCYL